MTLDPDSRLADCVARLKGVAEKLMATPVTPQRDWLDTKLEDPEFRAGFERELAATKAEPETIPVPRDSLNEFLEIVDRSMKWPAPLGSRVKTLLDDFRSLLSAPPPAELELSIQAIGRILGWSTYDRERFERGEWHATAEDCDQNAQYHEERASALRALARLLRVQGKPQGRTPPSPDPSPTDFFTDQLDQANRQRHLAFEAQKEADFHAARKFHKDADQLTDLVSVVVLLCKRYPHLPDLAEALSRWSEEIQEWYDAAQELAEEQLKPEEMP